MGRAAVFLDRDGTVIREVEYLTSPKGLRLLPGAAEAIGRLNGAGLAVVVVTNQSGIGRGLLSEKDLGDIHDALEARLARRGAHLDGIHFCPHHPEAAVAGYRRRCRCRKPAPGMLLRAARELDLDLGRSFAIGDSERDVEAGRRVGCRTVLVRSGYGAATEARLGEGLGADRVADDLRAAAEWILGRERKRRRAGKRTAGR